jgi:hypothetical protein
MAEIARLAITAQIETDSDDLVIGILLLRSTNGQADGRVPEQFP